MAADVSENVRRAGQRNQTALLRGLTEVSQKRAAELLGISESAMSDFKRDQLERFCALAAVCGLRFVPVTDRTIDDDHINALETLAAIALRSRREARSDERDSGFGGLT
jgi:hypothetical protein